MKFDPAFASFALAVIGALGIALVYITIVAPALQQVARTLEGLS